MSRKQRIYEYCLYACQNNMMTVLDGLPVSAFRYIQKDVEAFNKSNPPFECELIRRGDDLFVLPKKTNLPKHNIVNDLRAITGLSQDVDDQYAVLKSYYDEAMKKNVALIREGFRRELVNSCIEKWNFAKDGDVMARKLAGSWVFYRRKWLNGRNFYSAIDKWERTRRR